MSNHDFDVIISGYGPTGQALASLLSRQGHSVCVFERWPSLYGLPRLCTLDGESARIIQAAGDVDYALRDSNACRRYFLVNEDHKILIDIDWSADHISGFPLRISMYQPDIEDAMDTAGRERGAEINQGWEVVAVEQDEDGATVRARANAFDAAGNLVSHSEHEERVLRAKYVVGADGARSAIRRSLRIQSDEYPFRNAWLSIDALRKRELPTLAGISEDIRIPVVVCAPEGKTNASVPIGASRLRFEFLVDPDSEHDEHLSPEVGYRYLKEVHGIDEDDVEIYRQVIYPFAGRIAQDWREGRVFLAGDAAHLMTPFLGQGACSGLRDSVNLAWKLSLVLNGFSPDSILDTYEAERRPHVTVHVAGSDALGAMACEPDREAAAKRDEMFFSGQAPEPPAEPVLEAGVLHVESGDTPALPVGDIAPQGVVRYQGREGRFDDVVGWGFQLIVQGLDATKVLSREQLGFLERVGCHVVSIEETPGPNTAIDVSGAYQKFFDTHDIRGILMRPDFVLFGVIKTAEDVPDLVSDLRAQLDVRVPTQ